MAPSAPKARRSGAPWMASTTCAESAPPSAAAASLSAPLPGQEGGDRARHGEGNPEGERGDGKFESDHHESDDGRAGRDTEREQRPQVEVLQRVHVVDRPGEQVPAAPPGERGRDARGQAVVEPDAPAGQGPQGGVVADQALGVAQGPAQEGQDLDGRQYAGQGAQPGRESGAAEDVARSGQEPDGGRRRGQTEQSGQRQASVGRPGFGQDAADGLHGATAGSGAPRDVDDGIEVGQEERLVGGHDDGPPGQPRRDGLRQSSRGRRIEGRRGLVEQQDGGRTQEGPRQRHPLSFPGAEGQAVLPERRRQARGEMGTSRSRPTAAMTCRSSSSVASGAPSRRFSASVAVKR